MQKVTMINTRHIPGHGLFEVGDEPELPDALAKQLCSQGHARRSPGRDKPKRTNSPASDHKSGTGTTDKEG